MPTQQTFLGATIRSISSSIGLGSQTSQITIQLIVDASHGDSLISPTIGTPVFFSYGAMSFSGLLQKCEQEGDINGKPLYKAIIVDPRELLEGAQIITAAYAGTVGAVKNLFNAFGWWENQVFGASLSNDAGMPWLKIRDAVLAMCNDGAGGIYGSPLKFQGQTYSLDLSQLPSPPIYYRMPGPNIGLLQAIEQICEDSGCDFFVELVGYTIKIRTISRLAQPPLGTISSFANANIGTTIRSNYGVELRNEITSSFLVGGEQDRLHLTTSIYQFFGYDVDGFPIVGSNGSVTFTDKSGSAITSVNCLNVTLNASEIADIIGSVYYPTTTVELRLAKGCDYNAWAAYMYAYRPSLAAMIGLTVINANIAGVTQFLNKSDVVNDSTSTANAMIMSQISSDANVRSLRVYDFVRKMADEYYGRKYLVAIPFILSYTDPETLKVVNSYDISGEGAFLPEGSAPLGLSLLNEDIFKNPDGRFRTFVEYASIANADLSCVSPQGSVVEDGSLFVEVQVDPNIVFYGGYPFALVTMPCALYQRAVDSMGGSTLAAAATLQMSGQAAQNILTNAYIGGIRIHPEVIVPSFAAIPLRSNIFTYGPWYFAGVPGKVKFDYDPSMTPWNYGDYETMNLAGFSRVATASTNMLISESGSLEIAGAPNFSLGDILQSGGPNITNIDVSISTEGITTSLRFQTFTPKFGVFSKGNVERMQRLSTNGVSLRRAVRSALRAATIKQETLNGAAYALKTFMQNAPKTMKKETPHDTFVSHSFYDSDTSTTRMTCQMATYEEAVSLSNANDSSEFRETVVMSMNGLFRPFSTSLDVHSNNMPTFGEDQVLRGCDCLTTLNPFAAANDIEVYTWGGAYNGLNAFRRGGNPSTARAMALRGPIIVSGFGRGIDGKLVPKHPDNDGYADDYLTRQDKWKVGPVDLLYDDKRACWTPHGSLMGKTGSEFRAADATGNNGGSKSGLFIVKSNDGDNSKDWEMTAWNYYSTGISGDLKAMITWQPTFGKWFITSVDCSGQ